MGRHGCRDESGTNAGLAGLLQTRVEARNSGLPWLADLPWFGVPFRRVREEVNEIELLIMVTPEFVDAVDPEEVPPCGPGESTTSPNDVELYWRGYMEVPKCCEDGSCPKCQNGAPSETIAENITAAGPHEALPQGAAADARWAARVSGESGRRRNRLSKTNKPAVRWDDGGRSGGKPTLIGPVGYDALK